MKRQFDVSGDIRDVDLLAGLVGLWRDKGSVALDFTRAGVTSGFDVADGDIVSTFSADPRFETAAILVRAGKLDGAALERLAAPEGSDRALGAMQAGVLTRREWKWGEKIRAIEVLSDLLTWKEGRYLVERDMRSAAGEFRLPIPRLVLELFLRSRDRALVEHQLGNPESQLGRSEEFDREFATFGLTADAESVVRLIDGRATAREIAARAPADAFAVEKLLAALVTLELLRPAGPGQAVTAAPASAPFEPSTPQDSVPAEPVVSEDGELLENVGAPAVDPSLEAEIESPAPVAPDALLELPELSEPLRLAQEVEAPGAEGSFETPALDAVAVGAEPPPRAPGSDWDTLAPGPPDPILERPEEPVLGSTGGGHGRLLLGVLFALAAAVGAVLLLKSRSGGSSPPVAPKPQAAAAIATTTPDLPKPTQVPPTVAAPTVVRPSPAKPTARATALPTRASTRAAVPNPTRVPTASPLRAAVVAADRKPWLDRAQALQRRLAGEPGTRYAVQLLLACEVPTLEDAFRHDRPGGSMWLLPSEHGGRMCFRVLWGRFATVEEARKAKDGVPSHFVSASNRPAVVAVR